MRNKRKRLEKIFEELQRIKGLYYVQTEALEYCYDANKDYYHVFEMSDLIINRFKNVIERLDIYLIKMYKTKKDS